MAKRIYTKDDLNTDNKDIIRAYCEFSEYHNETQAWRLERLENQEFYFAQNKAHLSGVEETKDPSTVLFSSIESLVADFNDAFPEPTIVPQEKNDREFADQLKSIVRCIFDRRNYEAIYNKKNRRMCIDGLAVQEVFWDSSLYNGLGDVNMRVIDGVYFYWDTHTDELQDGRSCIKIAFHPKEWYKARFGPDVFANMNLEGRDPVGSEIHYYMQQMGFGEYADTKDIMLMEYWFKSHDEDGNVTGVHCLKIAGGCLLEDSRDEFPEGVYDDMQYPFIVEPMFQFQGHVHGKGIIDIFKRRAITLDRLNQYILKFAELASKSRYFYDKGLDIDWEAFKDETQEFIAASGLQTKMIEQIIPPQLPQWVRDWYMLQTDELKTEVGRTSFHAARRGKALPPPQPFQSCRSISKTIAPDDFANLCWVQATCKHGYIAHGAVLHRGPCLLYPWH
jgi:hypothetical protein